MAIQPWFQDDLGVLRPKFQAKGECSLCALDLFNTRVSQFELNYWNKLTFPQHSNLLRGTCKRSEIESKRVICIWKLLLWTHIYAVKITLYASETDNCKASKPTKKLIRVIAGTLGVAKSTVWTGELINIIRCNVYWQEFNSTSHQKGGAAKESASL